jgi:hypothetical protein
MGSRLLDLSQGELNKAVRYGYRIALGRLPSPDENEQALAFLDDDLARLLDFSWSLLNTTEFIYVK